MNYINALILFTKTRLRKFYHPEIYKALNTEIQSRQAFYASFLAKGDITFDVGANLGNRIQPLLNLGIKVVAIEPQSLCFNYLKLIYGKKITLLKLAMGSKKYASVIRVNKQSSTISSMSDEWIESVKSSRFKNLDWNKTEEVNVDTLNNLITAYGKPKFVKIDVEGFETEVLKGLSIPVPIISFEYTTPEQADKMYECLALLNTLDPAYRYNYSSGESNTFKLQEWISYEALVSLANKDIHALEGFGDVYAKQEFIKFR